MPQATLLAIEAAVAIAVPFTALVGFTSLPFPLCAAAHSMSSPCRRAPRA